MVTCDHRLDAIGQPIYVKGYFSILTMTVAAVEDLLFQSLPVLLIEFPFTLANVAEIFEDFAHLQDGCIYKEKLLSSFRPASDATLVRPST